MIATLRIQVLFHWESQQARALAGRLYRTFSARPTGDGPRIPVRFGPRRSDGGAPAVELGADHEIFVILVDERMARRARSSDRRAADSWAELGSELLRDHPPGTGSPHHVLPVALDSEALQLSPALSDVSFVRLDVAEGEAKNRHLVLHIAIRALRALQELPRLAEKPADEYPDIPVQLFISHAKKDLPRDFAAMAEGPVRAILAKLRDLPLAGWYDAAEIPAGGRFPEEIQKGVLKSSALVTVLTDAWSTREWCRREVLEAKLAARPLIIVDALEARVVRLFPYVGNAMTLRWRAAIAAPSDPATEAWKPQRALWEAEDAALVIEAALLEALRYQHDHARLRGLAGENEVALGAPPEALTLAHLPGGTKRVWYPDPPLGQEELAKLQPGAGDPKTRIELTTPLTELAHWKRPPGIQTVAVSLSNAPDTEIYGGSLEHLTTFADDLVLYLLAAGLRVAYGGVLGHDALQNGAVEGDEINYVERLLAMVRSHSMLLGELRGLAREDAAPIQNWVAWPIHLRFGDNELRLYQKEATLEELGPPLDINLNELNAPPNVFVPPDTPSRRYAWARSLTYMRESMLKGTSARIVMGGRLAKYQGLWPGVLEEGVLSVRAAQPLYLLGLFGGAARLLIDTLRGIDRPELAGGGLSRLPNAEELHEEYRRHGQAFQTPEDLAAELKKIGAGGLAAALNNGLSEEENAELIGSDDPQRIVSLILAGLSRKLSA